jgi:drug/metabolite transporter (DMT)-like permease
MHRIPLLSDRSSSRLAAVFQALFVAFLWSTSWVLIKIGLNELPPLTFAGLRYGLATLVLITVGLRKDRLRQLRKISRSLLMRLFLLGLLFYAFTQGAQYLALNYLPAITVNLFLSLTSILVALLGIPTLGERPLFHQWAGVAIAILGAVIFFYPVTIPDRQVIGIIAVIIGLISNAVSSILSREVNRSHENDPLLVTTVSMGIGAVVLLAVGVRVQGLPTISLTNWIILLWLALVNTAFAFTLWNRTLRTLSAMESSIINNTMLIQIPLLAVIFLGERITWRAGIGLVVAGLGTLLVQLRIRMPSKQRCYAAQGIKETVSDSDPELTPSPGP